VDMLRKLGTSAENDVSVMSLWGDICKYFKFKL